MIIVTGTIAYDYIMDFPGSFGDHILPDQIHKINLSFAVDKFEKRRGGTAGNVSYTLNLLKTPHVLYSFAGKDFDEYEKYFRKIGISTKNVHIDKFQNTSTGFAMTDKVDNQIWGYFFGASENISKLNLKKVAKKNDLVLIGPSGKKGTISFLNQCAKQGLRYMFDLGFTVIDIDKHDLFYGITNATYIVGNDYEIRLAKKKLNNDKKILKEKIIVTTFGKKGSLIENKGEKINIKSAKPEKVVDPTGVGDAWRAGFLTGIERGFDIRVCGQMGSVAASFAVEEYGTQEHKLTIKDFKTRYRQTYKSLLNL